MSNVKLNMLCDNSKLNYFFCRIPLFGSPFGDPPPSERPGGESSAGESPGGDIGRGEAPRGPGGPAAAAHETWVARRPGGYMRGRESEIVRA